MARYRSRISGPLRDRIDLVVPVHSVPLRELAGGPTGEGSASVRERVIGARDRQRERRSGKGVTTNAELRPEELARWCRLRGGAMELLEGAESTMGLSSRGVHRVLRVARTIADLEGAGEVGRTHLAEALQYRG